MMEAFQSLKGWLCSIAGNISATFATELIGIQMGARILELHSSTQGEKALVLGLTWLTKVEPLCEFEERIAKISDKPFLQDLRETYVGDYPEVQNRGYHAREGPSCHTQDLPVIPQRCV